ncbi:RNA-binding protein [Carnobacterium sp. TMP28]|uniref:YlmH family RNA-binding protein n=1 Tax=Carnobacterium sp. TMP28 TaxID=3397060 RepID=UPI0039E08B1A
MIENVYQHFRKEERPFIDQVTGWIRECEDQYTPYLTNFLDPRQTYIVETIVGKRSGIKIYSFGGYQTAERNRLYICPEYFIPKQEDFDVSLFEIRYPIKFTKLSHGKILGTVLSTGLKRDYFGDIISDGERWQFFICDSMKSFVQIQVEKIGNVTIRFVEKTYLDILKPIDSWTIVQETVSSMRLDTIVASLFNISRQRSKQMIESGKIKLNWSEITQPDFELGVLDIVSIRGFGRLQVQEIEGKTKKDKWRIKFGVLHK